MSKLPATAELVLYQGIRDILLAARTQVRQTVNTAMVQTYWQIGRLIVEGEQGGDKRAAYGKGVLTNLASRLTAEFGEGFRLSNLRNFRQFHECFSEHEIRHTVCSELAWSHLRLLMRVEDPIARVWYANEAVTQGWSGQTAECFLCFAPMSGLGYSRRNRLGARTSSQSQRHHQWLSLAAQAVGSQDTLGGR